MLAPGDYLTRPATEALPAVVPSVPPPASEGTSPTATQTEQPEEGDSFLLRLLRALGAIHT